MKSFLHTAILSIIALIASVSALAQENMSAADRERWLSTIREHKHEFLAKDLELTKDQQKEFFPLYDSMEDEIERVNAETREIEKRLNDNADATDLDIENGARTIFEQKRAEGQIEMTYFEKFRTILTPRQLLKLKNSERRFNQQLVNHHRRISGGRKNPSAR